MTQNFQHRDPIEEFDPVFDPLSEPFQFSDTALKDFQAILGVTGSAFEREVLPEIQSVAADYRRWIAQKDAAPSRAEINKELRKLAADAKALAICLRSLDNDALFEVIHWFESETTSSEPRRERLARELEDLARAVRRAHRARATQTGPEKNRDLGMAVGRLVDLYEQASGKAATHTPSKGSGYDGTPRSPTGRFLKVFFSEAGPREGASKVTDSAISSALATLIRERNRKRRNRKVHPSKSG